MKWLSDQWEWLKGIVKDDNGERPSWKKVASFLVVIAFIRSYWHIALEKTELVDIPETWAIMLAALLGLGILSNYVNQKKTNGDDSRPKL